MSTAVYPVTPENFYLLKAIRDANPEMNVNTAVIPGAYSRECRPDNGFSACHKLSELPEEVDTVFFLSCPNTEKLLKSVRATVLAGKHAVCCGQIRPEKAEELRQLAESRGAKVTFFNTMETMERLKRREDPYIPQESIVIAVGALTRGISTSAAVIGLRDELAEQGYGVSVIASDPDLQMAGCDFLDVSDLIEQSLDHTIMRINSFLDFHQLRYRSDVILLQLPDEGLHRPSNEYETCFGAETYLISQAVSIDYGVMLSAVLDSYAMTYQKLSGIARQRYGFGYDTICILPQMPDATASAAAGRVDYFGMPEEDANAIMEAILESAKEGENGDVLFLDVRQEWLPDAVQDIIGKLS